LGAQLKYADRRGHSFAVIIGQSEFDAGTAQIKVLSSGESVEVPVAELATSLLAMVEA
ncbi:MAG: histidine--tRNA ligase, partial [Acidimicrobiia bacterium]|nr:histidine--tRNA ligase [Acidimicrobiia bacterium]